MARRPYKVKLPNDTFVLEHVSKQEPFYEGPWDPAFAEVDRTTGEVCLHSDGAPVILRVTRQRGDEITLDDGVVMRFAAVPSPVQFEI
jgi:hypothetical protein